MTYNIVCHMSFFIRHMIDHHMRAEWWFAPPDIPSHFSSHFRTSILFSHLIHENNELRGRQNESIDYIARVRAGFDCIELFDIRIVCIVHLHNVMILRLFIERYI